LFQNLYHIDGRLRKKFVNETWYENVYFHKKITSKKRLGKRVRGCLDFVFDAEKVRFFV